MLFALVIFVILAGMCALPFIFRWYDAAAKIRSEGPEDEKRVATRPSRPDSLEGVMVAQLTAGEITRVQYQRAMAKIAARDDERHPLSVPPAPGGTEV